MYSPMNKRERERDNQLLLDQSESTADIGRTRASLRRLIVQAYVDGCQPW